MNDSRNIVHPWAALICLFGVLLHIILSDPLLTALGVHYSGEEDKFYEKIHPGTVIIFFSFFVFLWSRGRPLGELIDAFQRAPAFVLLLMLYVLLLLYMLARSGPAGMALIPDTHMTAAICAIVLSTAPQSYCKKAAYCFIALALCNSLIGIAESLGNFRIFEFDPEWGVLKEEYFRASALLGHPLSNAMFTVVALCVAMGMRCAVVIRLFCAGVFVASLVAFGGRVALAFALVALLILVIAAARNALRSGHNRLVRLFIVSALLMTLPVGLLGGVYALVESHIGQRIAATAWWEKSAESRLLVLKAFDYMHDDELIFGVSGNRILDITDRMNQSMPLAVIENPWVLMCMRLGLITFPFWCAATLAFAWRLMKAQPLALQLAVVAYFVVASSSNSFAAKDANYAIMVSAVVCASRAYKGREELLI